MSTVYDIGNFDYKNLIDYKYNNSIKNIEQLKKTLLMMKIMKLLIIMKIMKIIKTIKVIYKRNCIIILKLLIIHTNKKYLIFLNMTKINYHLKI